MQRQSFYYKSILLFVLMFVSSCATVFAQTQKIKGVLKDKQSDEPIPFASVVTKLGQRGVLTDSAGEFILTIPKTKNDTLEISSVGYKKILLPLNTDKDSLLLVFKMEVLPPSNEASVKGKYNRALWFWKKIIQHKDKNNRTRWDNYTYEIYNKLELDLSNVKKDKLVKNKLLKPFDFVLESIDSTSEAKPFLPVFLTETISDYYYQKNPKRYREVIRASKTNGIDNESVTKLLGGMYQLVNAYNNFIPVFDKEFVSPFNDNGDSYYNFKLADTQYLNKKRLVHFRFFPKHVGQNTFEGDCWINDTSFAIQKITLRPSAEANINFMEGLSLIQEYKLINDSTWFLYKDKFVADVSPTGKNHLGFKGRKTSTYHNIQLNTDIAVIELAKNKKAEEVIVIPDSEKKVDTFWDTNRHEQLSKQEAGVYKMIDSITHHPMFERYTNTIRFLGTGYKDIGNITIGQWYNWLSYNSWEGLRVRFDASTNTGFNRKIRLHTYLAYGFGDQQLKGKAEIFFLPKRSPRFYLYGSYTNDLDNGQIYYDEISTDNIFSLAVRKNNIPVKNMKVEEQRFELFKETNKGLSFHFAAAHKLYEPLRNLPDKSYFASAMHQPLNNFETSVRVRFAYLERFIENNFFRTSLGSDLPIAEVKYTKGWSNVLNSSYDYHKIDASISDYIKVPPYGSFYFNVFGGKTFGTLPFTMLQVQPGNEIYYYNKYAFNLMNRFEFVTDSYAGFNIEHNIGNGLFRFIPLTRKLRFRQFWSAKSVWGNLSDENKNLNFVGTNYFKSLDGKMYMELGTGVDNIFKVFRLDFIWRVAPTPLPDAQQERFGVFGSFRLTF